MLAGCSSATQPVDVDVRPSYEPGRSYYGREQYIEYLPGSLPVILTAPHGGSLLPAEIPDRTATLCGGAATTVTDSNTREQVLAIRDTMFARFGRYPHVVISHLSRRRLDPNRPVGEGACGDVEAATAWSEFQAFVDSAKSAVTRARGRGWYMDMHGHGHSIQRLELGYLLSSDALDRSDVALNSIVAYEDTSSIRSISIASQLSFTQLLRGPSSLGELYAQNGFPAVPSVSAPGPAGAAYFSGGYNTARHGCGVESGTVGGMICGVQVESNFTGVRDTALNRARFASVTSTVLSLYLKQHWGLDLTKP